MDDQDSLVQSRKRRRLMSDDGVLDSVDGDSVQSAVKEPGDDLVPSLPAPLPRKVMEFNDKLVQVVHPTLQPSSTPDHLQHRFMVSAAIAYSIQCVFEHCHLIFAIFTAHTKN